MEKKNSYSESRIIVTFLIFSIIFVFFNSKSSPLYLFNEWGDANIYFSIGKGIVNGLVPYKDIFDHKGPLIFFLYSIAYLISNTNFLGVYILECTALFVNILFAYKIAKLYLNRAFSYITALSFAVFLFHKSYFGGSAEEFISVFITISFYYFILYFTHKEQSQRETNKQMLIHGVMSTLTFLTKLSVCTFWIPILIAIFLSLLKEKNYGKLGKFVFYYSLGVVVTLLPFLLYFVSNNATQDFYFGYIEFNSIYAEFKPDLAFLRKIVAHLYKLILFEYISTGILLLGVFVLSFSKKYIPNPIHRMGILFSFVMSFAVMCISKYIMTYAHIIIYVYALFGLIYLLGLIKKQINEKYNSTLYTASFLVLLGIGIADKEFFNEDIECLTRQKECSYMQKEFADIINKEKNPTLLNIGLDFGIYTKANIVPTYKYFFYPNMPYELFPEIRDYQKQLIVDKEPMFIVIGDNSLYFDYYEELPELKQNYDLVCVYNQNIVEFSKTMYLYKKKDQ